MLSGNLVSVCETFRLTLTACILPAVSDMDSSLSGLMLDTSADGSDVVIREYPVIEIKDIEKINRTESMALKAGFKKSFRNLSNNVSGRFIHMNLLTNAGCFKSSSCFSKFIRFE